jgi:hypothetical protein
VGRLDGLGRADRAAAQQVQRAVVGDPEQPGAEWRVLLQLVQGDEGPGKVSCTTSSPSITEPIRRAQ